MEKMELNKVLTELRTLEQGEKVSPEVQNYFKVLQEGIDKINEGLKKGPNIVSPEFKKYVELLQTGIEKMNKELNVPKKRATALRGFLKSYRIDWVEKMDAKTFLEVNKYNVVSLLNKHAKPIKMKLLLEVEFYKKGNKGKVYTYGYFHSRIEVVTDATTLSEVYDRMVALMLEKLSSFQNQGEKYISFKKEIVVDTFVDYNSIVCEVKREIRFIDSLKFMAASLDSLVSNLEKAQFNNMKQFYEGKQLELLLRKGVYPYDYMNSLEKLEETELPQKELFYSKLDNKNISDADYQHAEEVWSAFNIQTMREYHDLYLKSDVILLADVFETFRDVCLKNYKLDPC
ncbi:hypothetical protein QZH41_019243 [Actinostola sp. cb2023]|nr:hypothetical protein QZH41_019243 [Actinostola sp. cb2023]